MELWIRSQDKNLLERACMVKVEQIQEKKFENGKEIITFKHGIIVNNDYVYGEYKTEKKALEVLDEIQNILMPKSIIKFDAIVNEEDLQRFKKAFNENETIILNKATIEHLDTYVYEMPEE